MKDKILLIGNKYDVHADSIVACCRNKGREIIRLNSEDFRTNDIKIDITRGQTTIKTRENRVIDSREIQSVYVRRISPFNCENIEDSYKNFVINETKEVLTALEFLFANSRWMDKFSIRDIASNKINQLLIAEKSGLSIPETLITNSPKEFDNFSSSRNIVYKTLFIPVIDFEDRGTGIINTTLIGESHSEHINNTLPVAPSLFQVYVDKKFELRVHVIGEKIVAVKIDSQKIKEAKIDWRCVNFDQLEYSKYNLPIDISEKIFRFMKCLKLNFGIIDMVVTPENKFIFLEINPNGNWLWIERAIKVSISEMITDWLCS